MLRPGKWLSLFQFSPCLWWLPPGSLILLLAGCASNRPALATGAQTRALGASATATAAPAARSQTDDDERTGVKAANYIPPPLDPSAEVAVRVRAQVNGVPILDDEIREACYPQLVAIQSVPEPERSARRAEILRQQLQAIIERELILQDMNSRMGKNKRALDKIQELANKEFDKRIRTLKEHSPDVKTDEDVKKKFQSMGLSLAGFKRQVEREYIAREFMRSFYLFPAVDSGIGHQEILEYYQHHPEEFQRDDRVHWQDIFVDKNKFKDRDEAYRFAEQLAAHARAGEDFLKLAAQYDSANYAFSKGEGFGQLKGEIKPSEVEAQLFQMREGQIGIVELATGFHVYRLAKREFAGRVPLDDKVQEDIRKKLQGQIAEREYKWALNDLKKKARIEIMGD